MPPQPSGIVPQFLPCIVQVVGMHPHLVGMPPPPQDFGSVQVFVQVKTLPHPSEIEPHSAPSEAHVFGTQGVAPHRFGPAPPHTSAPVQALQSSMPPQPSGIVPQL